MASDDLNVIAFRCSGCSKRLKAPAKAAGRTLKCPKCRMQVDVPLTSDPLSVNTIDPAAPKASEPQIPMALETVASPADEPVVHANDKPASEPARPVSSFDTDDPFILDIPAIADIEERQATTKEFKAEKERQRQAARQRSLPKEKPGALQPIRNSQKFTEGKSPEQSSAPAAGSKAPATSKAEPRESLFDDDLPELAALEETSKRSVAPGASLAAQLAASVDLPSADNDLQRLGDLIPELDASADTDLPALFEEPSPDEYRIVCKTCGTGQYVAPSVQGMKVKCPDCFSEFKAPPPPAGWGKGKKKLQLSQDDMPLAPPEELSREKSAATKRDRTRDLLEKASKEVTDEEIEQLYDTDFDTSGFLQRTFGFVFDSITMSQVLGYGFVFACLFALTQFGANDVESDFGRGVLLLTFVLVPLVAMLFALPMLSGGLALIEAVANKDRVREFPVFNIFDNVGEVLLIAIAMFASIVPGFFLGTWASDGGAGGTIFKISGMMVTCFALFPIFLLSMMDNNSIFQPISGTVLRSLKDAAEAWGTYYFKTLIGFFTVLVLWYLLLSTRSVAAAAVAGTMLPLLIFFICQQIGVLAEGVAEHLSFEFAAPESKEDDADSRSETSLDD